MWSPTEGSGDHICFLHESTRSVELRLHTDNQRPMCRRSGLKVSGGWAGGEVRLRYRAWRNGACDRPIIDIWCFMHFLTMLHSSEMYKYTPGTRVGLGGHNRIQLISHYPLFA